MTTIDIPLDDLDRSLRIRSLCEETVEDYAAAMLRGDVFPPGDVIQDETDGTYYLTDGFHRCEAESRNGSKTLRCRVLYEGTKEDALWATLGGNRINGMRLAPDDKRKAIEIALQRFPHKSLRTIAEHVGCHHSYVAKIRCLLVDTCEGVTNVTPESQNLPDSANCVKKGIKIPDDWDVIPEDGQTSFDPINDEEHDEPSQPEEIFEEEDDDDWGDLESEGDEEEEAEPPKVTGRDGKQYPAKRNPKPKGGEKESYRFTDREEGDGAKAVEFEGKTYYVCPTREVCVLVDGKYGPALLIPEIKEELYLRAFPPPPYTVAERAWFDTFRDVVFAMPGTLAFRTHEGQVIVESAVDSQKPSLDSCPIHRGSDWENWPFRPFFKFSDCDLESFASAGVKTVGDLSKVASAVTFERIVVPKFGKKKIEQLEDQFIEFWKRHPELCQSNQERSIS